MSDPVTIVSGPSPNPGLNYNGLKRDGVKLTQGWSGAIWTDYNEHDPGVTTLEQLCYALTELSYRAELSVADLLTDPDTGEINNQALALDDPTTILPVNPVTPKDYRKLLLDRVPQLANIWFEPEVADDGCAASGQYQVFAMACDRSSERVSGDIGPSDADSAVGEAQHHHRHHHHHHDSLKRDILQIYQAHRNLCEDVQSITVLRDCPINVQADVSIGSGRPSDDILADIYFALTMLFAPEPKRHSLKEAMGMGIALEAILDGPIMFDGLIVKGQLTNRAKSFSGTQMVSAINSVADVFGVRNLRVVVDGRRIGPDEIDRIVVPDGEIFRLQQRMADCSYSIRLLQGGVVLPESSNTARRFNRLVSKQRQRFRLTSEYGHTLKFPSGSHRDVKPYFSIQNQYPNVYGIGEAGPPANADQTRLAQAKQLKGFLLPFEQLLADFCAQLASVDDLFSITPADELTYFSQSLLHSVPDIAPLLPEDYEQRLKGIVASADDSGERRKRFLDLTLAIYAQHIDLATLAEVLSIRSDARFEIINKQSLLGLMSIITNRRGAAGDPGTHSDANSTPGMLIKSRIELGIAPFGSGELDRGQADQEYDNRHHHHHHHHHHQHGASLEIYESGRGHHRDRGMTITADFNPGPLEQNRGAYIDLAQRVVRRNTPAHIAVNFRVCGPGDTASFNTYPTAEKADR